MFHAYAVLFNEVVISHICVTFGLLFGRFQIPVLNKEASTVINDVPA